MNHVGRDLDKTRSGKRWLTSNAFVKHATQSEQIAPRVDVSPRGLFGRKIGWCTKHRAAARTQVEQGLRFGFRNVNRLLIQLFRQSEVEYFDLTSFINHDV